MFYWIQGKKEILRNSWKANETDWFPINGLPDEFSWPKPNLRWRKSLLTEWHPLVRAGRYRRRKGTAEQHLLRWLVPEIHRQWGLWPPFAVSWVWLDSLYPTSQGWSKESSTIYWKKWSTVTNRLKIKKKNKNKI